MEEDQVVGDLSAHRWSCTGTFTGPGGIIPGKPTGHQAQGTGTHVRDGRLVEVWHFGDWLGCLQGAGVLPALG